MFAENNVLNNKALISKVPLRGVQFKGNCIGEDCISAAYD